MTRSTRRARRARTEAFKLAGIVAGICVALPVSALGALIMGCVLSGNDAAFKAVIGLII